MEKVPSMDGARQGDREPHFEGEGQGGDRTLHEGDKALRNRNREPFIKRRGWEIGNPTLRQQGLRLRSLSRWQGKGQREPSMQRRGWGGGRGRPTLRQQGLRHRSLSRWQGKRKGHPP